MLENQVIGIAGVFVLTFCLIALYHLIGKIGASSKWYKAPTQQFNRRALDRRPDHLQKSSGKDDAWLLWSPEFDEPADPSKSIFGSTAKQKGL